MEYIVRDLGKYQPSLKSGGTEPLSDPYFDFGKLVDELSQGIYPPTVYNGTLAEKVRRNFARLFTTTSSRFLNNKSYNKALACLNILVGMMGTNPTIQNLFKEIIGQTAVTGFVAPKGQPLFSKLYLPTIYIGGLLKNEIGTIIYDNNTIFDFKDPLGNQLFQIDSATYTLVDAQGNQGVPGETDMNFNTGIPSTNGFDPEY